MSEIVLKRKQNPHRGHPLVIADTVLLVLAILVVGVIGVKEFTASRSSFESNVHSRIKEKECNRLCDVLDSCMVQAGMSQYMEKRDMVRSGCPNACIEHYATVQKCVPEEDVLPASGVGAGQCQATYLCMVTNLAGKFKVFLSPP